ncbi:hypothetical protein ACINK0_15155 [Deinococcus sp. VB343]
MRASGAGGGASGRGGYGVLGQVVSLA